LQRIKIMTLKITEISMKRIIALLLLLLPMVCCADFKLEKKSFLSNFIDGKYNLIGKKLDSDITYSGKISFASKAGKINLIRTIKGKSVQGIGQIQYTTADKIVVLRLSFTENAINYEETCQINSDLDNYARITCYLYRPGLTTKNPGLEAFFIEHE